MLVNSVIIVLREVLEAALMISILLSLSARIQLGNRWLLTGVALGITGAIAYATSLAPVSDMFDGVGQEIVNAAIHLGVFVALVSVVFLVARRSESRRGTRLLAGAMSAAIALAMTQEGSEIFIYVSGFMQMEEFVSGVSIGSLAGAAIGFSVGVFFYYFLQSLSARRALRVSLVLLAFAAASMCIQATGLLIQADLLQADAPVWDTSKLIGEGSIIGQLLYALVGYEATPSALEVAAYAGSLVTMLAAAMFGRLSHKAEPSNV